MSFCFTPNNLEYYTFETPPLADTVHGVFTRKGGISSTPFRSLNLGGAIGDTQENVRENRKRIFEAIDRPVDSLFDVWQVHSSEIVCTDRPRILSEPHQKADAIFTNHPDITLLMRFADCVPILIYDPVKKVVGIIHAGWQGTVNQIVVNALERIKLEYKCSPGDIIAAIGPSIGPDHYTIGDEVYKIAYPVFKEVHEDVLTHEEGRIFFNLWKANGYLLDKAGVKQVTYSNICTACDIEKWYSHRAENGKTGRFAAVIGLKG